MAIIRPCADLRNNYNEISKLCHQTDKPIYITKNGYNDLVLLSNESYEKLAEERIDKKIEEEFNKKYSDFENFRNDVLAKINLAIKDINEGKYRDIEDFCSELEEKYLSSKKWFSSNIYITYISL